MHRVNGLASAAFVFTLLGCDGAVTDSQTKNLPSSSRPTYNSGTALDPMSVAIVGPNNVNTPSTEVYHADVVGGTGPYIYRWQVRLCQFINNSTEPYCAPDYGGATEGTGVNSLSLDFLENDVWWDILLQVREQQTGYTTGVDSLRVYGPGLWKVGLIGVSNSFRCSEGQFYPFDEYKWVPGQGWRDTGRDFRRDACTNGREFDPTKPDTVAN